MVLFHITSSTNVSSCENADKMGVVVWTKQIIFLYPRRRECDVELCRLMHFIGLITKYCTREPRSKLGITPENGIRL